MHYRLATLTVCVGCTAAALTACDTLKPEQVCTNDETLQSVSSILIQQLKLDSSYDPKLVLEAWHDLADYTLVRFDGVNPGTKKISCQARIEFSEGFSWDITYDRQPNVKDGGYVYSAQFPQNYYEFGRLRSLMVEWVEKAGAYRQRVDNGEIDAPDAQDGASLATTLDDLKETAPLDPVQPAEPTSSSPSVEPKMREIVEPVRSSDPPSPVRVQRDDQVEYSGPPVIVPGPPPPAVRSTPPVSLITNPSWTRPPRAAFPNRASTLGIESGSATLSCGIGQRGQMMDCQIAAEDPLGAGFGEASLQAAQQAVLGPRQLVNLASDARVQFIVRFRID